jgi:hypothetical protein
MVMDMVGIPLYPNTLTSQTYKVVDWTQRKKEREVGRVITKATIVDMTYPCTI